MKLSKYLKRLILIICIFLWLTFIFGMSAKTGEESAGLSLKITRQMYKINFIRRIIKLNTLHILIRKCAHFTEYGILSILSFEFTITFEKYKKYILQTKYIQSLCPTVLFGVIVAVSDEFHQSFVPGRGPAIRDVCIDTSGVIVFLFIRVFIEKYFLSKNGN